MLTGKHLRSYLAYAVHGSRSPPSGEPNRKPPAKAKRAAPRKGPPRDEAYKAWIRTLPSLVSGLRPCDACHTETGGMSMKGSDFSCVPLTREEHMEYHKIGKRAFEQKHTLNLEVITQTLNEDWWNRCQQVVNQ